MRGFIDRHPLVFALLGVLAALLVEVTTGISGWATFWLAWVLTFAFGEAWAVISPRTGDTFTEQWRWIARRIAEPTAYGPWFGWAAVAVFVGGTAVGIVWLFWHFPVEWWLYR